MVRTMGFVLAALLLAGTGRSAEEAAPGGTWKLSFLNQGKMSTLWVVKLEQKGGKWAGSVVATAPVRGLPQDATVEDVSVADGLVRFVLRLQRQDFSFEGKVPAEAGKKVLGSIALGRQTVPADLEPTRLTTLDPYDVNRELVARGEGGPELFSAVQELIGVAAEKKVKPDEVRSWANKAFTAAEPYGTRWQREVALRLAESLLAQPGYAPVALEYARRVERLIDPKHDSTSQVRALDLLARALKQSGKEDEAREIEARADQLYLKKMPPFQPTKFEGRKQPSDRAVLVELFTGAQCPPCVAADLAFDALAQTYTPKEVVLLQYHLHIPGPDPLTNADTEVRAKFYGDEIEGTPTVLFNGKLGAGGGGFLDDAKDKYREYRDVLAPLLERPTAVKLQVKATRAGDKIDIVAEASGVETPGERVRLRLALVEEHVRYTGGNGLRFHHHVVRDLPGGADGLALTDKSGTQKATVDLAKLRDRLDKYLNEAGKQQAFPSTSRPLELKDLLVVAFVQNDATKEVLQAAQVKVGQ